MRSRMPWMNQICLHSFLIFLVSKNLTSAFKGLNLVNNKPGNRYGRVTASTSTDGEPPFEYACEVVGAFGRVGSFWLCHGATTEEGCSSAAVVPRGLSPGCQTKIGSPIYVATPSSEWQSIWQQTLEERRKDLVFIGNGLPPAYFKSATIVVPHFAILQRCKMKNDGEPCIQTNAKSPPTFVYGQHAEAISRILEANGVRTCILKIFSEVNEVAAFKLLWASIMWLICRIDRNILTVGEAHEQRQEEIDKLVDELFPALTELVGKNVDRPMLDSYLREYSLSIASAIPNIYLAIAEIDDRNGEWLSRISDVHPQHYHLELIRHIAGEETATNVLELVKQDGSLSRKIFDTKTRVEVGSNDLVLWGSKGLAEPAEKTVVIIGGGILGSSLALYLADRRPDLNITILDDLPKQTSGRTTPASWAWLNANAKSPKHYQLMNQLGLHAWKRDQRINHLVSWTGSLVRFEEKPSFVEDGGYPAEGPLSLSRLLELEPLADWELLDDASKPLPDQGYTYLFKDEGFVDPMEAVWTLREAAESKGASFLDGANVTHVTRDPVTNRVSGVNFLLNGKETGLGADTVIVAAGAGSAASGLACNIELLHRPGTIAFARPGSPTTSRLSRILVDPLRSSHVLQRRDGSIVAGGGALEVGGTVGTVATRSRAAHDKASLLDGAKSLAPELVGGCTLIQTCEAVRPMPVDGLPIFGYVEEGLYAAITHSGMTLGPFLSSVAAAEIGEGVSCEIMATYRPTRFHSSKGK